MITVTIYFPAEMHVFDRFDWLLEHGFMNYLPCTNDAGVDTYFLPGPSLGRVFRKSMQPAKRKIGRWD